jgi:hypothetical protein
MRKETSWLILANTGWNCAYGGHVHFIYLDDVYGKPLLIMLEGVSSAQEFTSKVDSSQDIVDTIVFTQ